MYSIIVLPFAVLTLWILLLLLRKIYLRYNMITLY